MGICALVRVGQILVPYAKPLPETGKLEVRLDTPPTRAGAKNHTTHKQVPITQPRPISLSTRPRGGVSTEEFNRGKRQQSHAQQLKTHL